MRLLRTLVLFDQGDITSSTEWSQIHQSYKASIESIDYPRGSGTLKLRRKVKRQGGQWQRNGVKYLKERFFEHMTKVEGWQPEAAVDLNRSRDPLQLRLYPNDEVYDAPVTSDFGSFDFVTQTEAGLRVAIEWETGNISSSHRSMNKLAIALQNGVIQAGILIVPSRPLYQHLTDRIGNIDELSGYLSLWAGFRTSVSHGLLAITVVEHDELTDDPDHTYLPTGSDGRALEGQAKRR